MSSAQSINDTRLLVAFTLNSTLCFLRPLLLGRAFVCCFPLLPGIIKLDGNTPFAECSTVQWRLLPQPQFFYQFVVWTWANLFLCLGLSFPILRIRSASALNLPCSFPYFHPGNFGSVGVTWSRSHKSYQRRSSSWHTFRSARQGAKRFRYLNNWACWVLPYGPLDRTVNFPREGTGRACGVLVRWVKMLIGVISVRG